MSTDVMHDAHAAHEQETAETKIWGFWIYLMTDCIMFAVVFATFAVLTAGVHYGKDIFDLSYVAIETASLLLSSITCGMAMIAAYRQDKSRTLLWLGMTFVFGVIFIGMEVNEFMELIADGHGPETHSYFSAFFSLVGMHGVHVVCGLIWLLVLMAQISGKGFNSMNMTRMACFSLFWHFLDIIWICVFSLVYLMGAV